MVGRILEIMRLLFMEVKDKLDARYGCFEIFAFDFLLGEDLTPRLMDVTSNPCFSTGLTANKALIRTLIRDVITIGSDLHEKGREKATEATL